MLQHREQRQSAWGDMLGEEALCEMAAAKSLFMEPAAGEGETLLGREHGVTPSFLTECLAHAHLLESERRFHTHKESINDRETWTPPPYASLSGWGFAVRNMHLGHTHAE